MCVAPSSRLGGYRDSGDDEAPLEAGTRQTASIPSTAGLFHGFLSQLFAPFYNLRLDLKSRTIDTLYELNENDVARS